MPLANGNKVVTATGFPEFKKISESSGSVGTNMVIFGPPGVGKTTFACTAQDSEYGKDVLLFDVDSGRESVSDRSDVSFHVPESWADLRSMLDVALKLKGESPYKTLVFDSLSSIYYELLVPKLTGSQEKAPQLQQYGEAQRILMKFIRDAKSLCEHGINTVFLGHVKEESDDGVVNIRLGLPPAVRDEVLLAVNHVGYLEYRQKTDDRVLHLRPPRRVSGPKFRQPRSGEQMPLEVPNPKMSDILNHVRKTKA